MFCFAIAILQPGRIADKCVDITKIDRKKQSFQQPYFLVVSFFPAYVSTSEQKYVVLVKLSCSACSNERDTCK